MSTASPTAPIDASPARLAPPPWPRVRKVAGLSAPIVLVLTAWSLIGLASLAMVGRLGVAAVAGVGVAGGFYAMLLAVLNGIDAGVQALVARRTGAGEAEAAGRTANEGLFLGLAVGAPLAAIAWFSGPIVVGLIVHDPAVVVAGRAYLAAIAPSLAILGMTYAVVAYWNGSGAPKFSLLVTVIEAPVAIGLNAVLIFGLFGAPRLGVLGAGLGSTLTAGFGLCAHLLLAGRVLKVPGFLKRPPSLDGITAIVRIGAPVSAQQCLLFVGLMLFLAIVARLGVRAVAVGNVLSAIMQVETLAATGIGIACATLAGGALGRREVSDARAWGWQASTFAGLLILPFSLAVMAAPQVVLGLFLHDPAAVGMGVVPLQILAAGMSLDAFGRVLGMAIRGVGSTRTATGVAFLMQWAVQLPLVWTVGLRLGLGLAGICASQFLVGAATLAVYALIWRGGSWDWTAKAGRG